MICSIARTKIWLLIERCILRNGNLGPRNQWCVLQWLCSIGAEWLEKRQYGEAPTLITFVDIAGEVCSEERKDTRSFSDQRLHHHIPWFKSTFSQHSTIYWSDFQVFMLQLLLLYCCIRIHGKICREEKFILNFPQYSPTSYHQCNGRCKVYGWRVSYLRQIYTTASSLI